MTHRHFKFLIDALTQEFKHLYANYDFGSFSQEGKMQQLFYESDSLTFSEKSYHLGTSKAMQCAF
jgi:hypothetical protein